MFRRKSNGPPGRLYLEDFVPEDWEEAPVSSREPYAKQSSRCSTPKHRGPLQCQNLAELVDNKGPEELVVLLSANFRWLLLLESPFKEEELRAIFSALRKCCAAPRTSLLEKFLSDTLTRDESFERRCVELISGLKRANLKFMEIIVSVLEVIARRRYTSLSSFSKALLDAIRLRCEDPLELDRRKGKGISTQHALIKERIKARVDTLCGVEPSVSEPAPQERKQNPRQTETSAPRNRRAGIAERWKDRLQGYSILRE